MSSNPIFIFGERNISTNVLKYIWLISKEHHCLIWCILQQLMRITNYVDFIQFYVCTRLINIFMDKNTFVAFFVLYVIFLNMYLFLVINVLCPILLLFSLTQTIDNLIQYIDDSTSGFRYWWINSNSNTIILKSTMYFVSDKALHLCVRWNLG